MSVFKIKQGIREKYIDAHKFYDEGKYEKAVILFRELKDKTRFNPNRLDALYYYGLLISDSDREQAQKVWEELLSTPSLSYERQAQVYFNLAKIDYDRGMTDRAREKFKEIIDKYPNNPATVIKSLYYIGEIERKKGIENYNNAIPWYEKILESGSGDETVALAKARLGEMNMALLFSPFNTKISQRYTVHPGDSLSSIATRFRTSVELLKESNRLTSNFIRPNDQLKVPTTVFSVKISKKTNTLILLADGKFFKEYLVGTGKYNKTPVGKFKITNKLVEPVWYKPEGGVIPYGDPDNLLGTRWMGINFPGYGIHGTWEEDSVGKQSSAGCIRLRNNEVEELFKILPVGTEVVITDN